MLTSEAAKSHNGSDGSFAKAVDEFEAWFGKILENDSQAHFELSLRLVVREGKITRHIIAPELATKHWSGC